MAGDAPRPGARGFPPTRKSLGQHFLTDRRILSRIVDALELKGGETVLEIGPGRGSLTEVLAERASRLIAIEYDRALAAILAERYANRDSVTIVEADVLSVNLGEVAGGPYLLVGNVPYYITTPILFHALVPPRSERSVYLVQREVAERLCASPGTGEFGALTVNVGALATAEIMFRVPAGAFKPPPKVESAVVRITPRDVPLIGASEEQPFRTMVQGAFGLRRKQMRRVVRTLFSLDAERADLLLGRAGINPEARPETLSVEQFVALLRSSKSAAAV